MSELGRPHPAVERYVSKAVSPNERIAALEAEVERLTRERDEARAQAEHAPNPGDLGVILALANGVPMGPFDRAAFARVRATLEKEDDRE